MKKIYYAIAFLFSSLPAVALAHTSEIVDEPYFHMMDWHWGSGMFGGAGTWGALFLISWAVWLGVGILALVWLWRKVNKK